MKSFQVVILVIFIIFAAAGIFLFATFRGDETIDDIEVAIWGSEDTPTFNNFLKEFDDNTNKAYNILYTEVDESNFVNSVVEAIASGEEPDIIILSSSNLLRFRDKILPIPYEVVSERDFKDTFIEGGEIFLSSEGVLAFPISVDPLVMYWNRDILQKNGFSIPPKTWSEFFPFAERVTEKDNALNIIKSAVALGEYSNINNSKEIILSLIMQNGNPIIIRDPLNDSLRVILSEDFDRVTVPAESAIKFYTEFSNPTKTSYSWNRSLPNSIDAFSSGDLALYFGFASELSEIRLKNPNLNFDVASFPQSSSESFGRVYGDIKALAVLKRSKNTNAAVIVASALIKEDNIASFSSITGLPPVRRGLLANSPGLQFEDLFYKSALISSAFLDPDYEKTNLIFENMINRIISGRERISWSVKRANIELNALVVDK